MQLSDFNASIRRLRIITMLDVALQDITEPTPTIEIARMIAKRLDTNETKLIGRILVGLAPKIPQARQLSTTFSRYGRDMHPWIWNPKNAQPLAAPAVAPKEPTETEKFEAAYNAWCEAQGLVREDDVWPEGSLKRFVASRADPEQDDAPEDGEDW